MTKTLEVATEHVLDLETKDGRPYKGRFTGTLIANTGDISVYLTADRNAVIYDESKSEIFTIEDPETDLRQWLDDDTYLEAMDALGIVGTIDLPI